jgi:hypothetical protein
MKFTVELEVTVVDGPKRPDLDELASEVEAELDNLSIEVGDSVCEVTAISVRPL